MDIGDFRSRVPHNQALNDLTNNYVKRTSLGITEQSLLGTHDEKVTEKRKRVFLGGLGSCDQRKKEKVHSAKAHETCKPAKGKALLFMNADPHDSLAKEYAESKGSEQINSLSSLGFFSDQENSLNNEADDLSTVLAPQYNSEADDSSTESDELKDKFSMVNEAIVGRPNSSVEQNEPAFSNVNMDTSILNKTIANGGDLTYEKSQYLSLFGSCLCSSCVKAAYMWIDLLYQDTRGRISALNNSRRHARILEGKILCNNQATKTSQGQLSDDRSTESDLLQHWTSLFLRTEDIVQREIVETQSRLIKIQNLKENCKKDLEKISSRHQNE